MIQVIKRVKVGGVVHESVMAFSEPEWALVQRHYAHGNITFEPIVKEKAKPVIFKAVAEAKDVDDKPVYKTYEDNRVAGTKHLKAKEYQTALRYFEKAYEEKESMWLKGQINKCIKKIEDENNSN